MVFSRFPVCATISARGEIDDKNIVFAGFESAQKFVRNLETKPFRAEFRYVVSFGEVNQNALLARMFDFDRRR